MTKHIVKIIQVDTVTHNVKRFQVERPDRYNFIPGQATEVAINQEKWKDKARPFTFTGLENWNYLEFVIKIYHDHQGVTAQMDHLKPGDELILHDAWGAIHYKGQGTFIAGGAGVTPFIAILRHLKKEDKLGNNKLIFSNLKEQDIILNEEFSEMLGDRFINTLTKENKEPYDNQMIDKNYLKEKIQDFDQYFYICGPDAMVTDLQQHLLELGAKKEKVITEDFE